ncbi:MAG: S-layer homology domain-containing protein, partial [Agathobaculum butyriciproducens]
MKKYRYTAAAVMLSLSMLTSAAAADYSDLKPHWAEQAMEFAVQSNLMDGISEYTFAADAPATRACLVQALYRMEHAPASDTVLTFQDVAEDASFLTAVQWGVSNGIITGYSDTVFRPGTSLTREQFAVMLYRFAEYKKLDVTAQSALSGYTDASSIHPYAQTAMQWANAEELITGTTATTLSPQRTVSRA